MHISRGVDRIVHYDVFEAWIVSFTMMYLRLVIVMVFNATFNNISAISWRSILLVEKTGGSGKKHRPVEIH
jgi:hypothetical protein